MTTISGTTPYAWPYDGQLVPALTAVLRLVIGEGSGVAGPHRDRADEVVESVRAVGGLVVNVITRPPARAPHTGHMRGGGTDHVIQSHGIDGFFGSPLDAFLRAADRDRLILVGDGLESCVHSTMRSANDRGYECLLVLDACRPHDPDLVGASASQVEMSGGIFGAIGSTAEVCRSFDSLSTLTSERSAS